MKKLFFILSISFLFQSCFSYKKVSYNTITMQSIETKNRDLMNFLAKSTLPMLSKREIKINKVELVDNALNYKAIVGSIMSKTLTNFTVKTKDSFVKVTEFEFDGKLKIGDRFEV